MTWLVFSVSAGNQKWYFAPSKDAYGKEVSLQYDAFPVISGRFGVTEDPDNSGIVADNNSPVDPFVWCIQVYHTATELSTLESAQLASQMQILASQMQNKAQIDFSNVKSNLDFVVESWKDGWSWYRKYRSGWVEQGGVINTFIKFTFFVEFTDTNYTIAGAYRNNNGAGDSLGFDSLKTTGARAIAAYSHDGDGYDHNKDCNVCWYACGF